ncbi:MAG: ribosomal L7Ae/L30e/S12e/Gadd45 family protein [Oscillospiraceae bacterium]|nr:ribosomal L7Ae/L30e/S12e/Gadd45 family protein [Oscillospiraceae bacterium]
MNPDASILQLIGLAKKAGRLEIGEELAGAAARSRTAALLLLAKDAADNTVRRACHFADAGKVPCLRLPFTKEELGLATGSAPCAILAFTDVGLAASLAKKLQTEQIQNSAEAVAFLEKREARIRRRRQEMRSRKAKRRKKQS